MLLTEENREQPRREGEGNLFCGQERFMFTVVLLLHTQDVRKRDAY